MRVEWTRMSGDEVEDVVAIMLLREHRRGTHIRPSQGDGGIDVLIPATAPDEAPTVYQVKKFATNLGSSEKRQIKDSILRAAGVVGRVRPAGRSALRRAPTEPDA